MIISKGIATFSADRYLKGLDEWLKYLSEQTSYIFRWQVTNHGRTERGATHSIQPINTWHVEVFVYAPGTHRLIRIVHYENDTLVPAVIIVADMTRTSDGGRFQGYTSLLDHMWRE